MACSTVKLVDLGSNRAGFDSSRVAVKRMDRLAYVSLFSFETLTHQAGDMSKKGEINSHGIRSPYQSTYNYKWDGDFTLVSGEQKITVSYQSTMGDVIIGDYVFDFMGWLSTKPRNTEYRGLAVSGSIRMEQDSAAFLYWIGEEGLSSLSEGLLIFREDTFVFQPITKEIQKGRTVNRVSYGYGMFLKDSMVAAADFQKEPNFIFIRRELPGTLRHMLLGYFTIAAGNKKIVPRRSTVLKRFY